MRRSLIISCLLGVYIVFIHAKEFNILNYGAVASKAVLSTAAIQKTIEECASAGGGTVIIPSGEYLSATLFLRSNIHLKLETGATIYASQNISDYEDVAIKHGASDAHMVNVLIAAFDCDNIKISGQGRLHGQARRQQYIREAEFDPDELITGREIANAAKYGADYRTKYRRVPPSPGLINITGCKNVLIEGIQLIESAFWTLHLQWCDQVFVRGLHITSSATDGVNSDGLDIDGCSRVVVSDCIIDTGDDALCLKTTGSPQKSKPCEDIVISNCILRSSSAALKIGTESYADFRRIAVSNCVINGANRGITMIIRDGGHVSDVSFSDMIIKTERKATFWWGNGDPVWLITANRTPESQTGTISRVTFNNMICTGQSGIRFEGFSSAIKDIRMNHVSLVMEHENAVDKRSRHGFHFYNLQNLELDKCSVTWNEQKPEATWQKAFNFDQIENLSLNEIKAKAAPGQEKAIQFSRITGDLPAGHEITP